MQIEIVEKFFNTSVVIVVHGHVMEGILTNGVAHGHGIGIVILTSSLGTSMVYDGYTQGASALVEVSSIDVIRPLLAPIAG